VNSLYHNASQIFYCIYFRVYELIERRNTLLISKALEPTFKEYLALVQNYLRQKIELKKVDQESLLEQERENSL